MIESLIYIDKKYRYMNENNIAYQMAVRKCFFLGGLQKIQP